MRALVWLIIPLSALVLGMLWVAWAGRDRPQADTHDTMAEHRRFAEAFDRDRDGRRSARDDSRGGRERDRRGGDDPG